MVQKVWTENILPELGVSLALLGAISGLSPGLVLKWI